MIDATDEPGASALHRAFRNKGNRRLWVVVTAIWVILASAYAFAKWPSEQEQIDSTVEFITRVCEPFVAGERYSVGERAYQMCFSKRSGKDEGLVPGINKVVCDISRTEAQASFEKEGRFKAENSCFDRESGRAEVHVRKERNQQQMFTAAMIILPPFVVPALAALLFLGGAWLANGYKRS